VPLEQFRTQVLLLHSEQTVLDRLSRGFSDRYTVHCATSGSEALNTLGETSIDVIVSTQDLPGMSGLESLREARRRSPETIGILLAGQAGNVVEALVGEDEVFQVVRGSVTPEALCSLVDSATSQTRLLALAESANDRSASVDEPAAEHIVMETSEDGSAIVSDGTGRMPALKPGQVSVSPSTGDRKIDVLVLTRDENFLKTVIESARGMHNVLHATTVEQAGDALREQPVGVAIVDAAMAGPDVEKTTLQLRSAAPRLVCIIAGRRNDGEMLMGLINRGKVYRFLLKPVSPGRARLAIEASVKHHLEAPDAAFKLAVTPAAAEKTEPGTRSKGRPKPTSPNADAQPAGVPAIGKAESAPADRDASGSARSAIVNDQAESSASNDRRFTETVAGIVNSVKPRPAGDAGTGYHEKRPVSVSGMAASSGSLSPIAKLTGVAVLLALVVIGWWALGGSGDPAITDEPAAVEEIAAETAPMPEAVSVAEAPTPATVDSTAGIDPALEDARLAAAAGRIVEPQGNNAIELYLAAAAEAPTDARIAEELAAVIEQALGIAETALLERNPDSAATALQRVSEAQPDNVRLPFLTAQLAQIQLLGLLDDARAAIRESRFEDAESAIESARSLGLEAGAEIDIVAEELSLALGDQRTEDVLTLANLRLEEGQLISPSNDNARYYYELALSSDPDNSVARQGLAVVASKLVLRARMQIDAGDFPAAELLLAETRRVDPSSIELAETDAALAAARDRQDQERIAAEQAEAERIAAEQAEAERIAAEQAEAERIAAEQAEAEQIAAEQAEAERIAAEQAAAPVPISSLTRTKYVAPKYPRAAQRRKLSGWVDVVFTLDIDGTVKDVVVKGSSPDDTFVNSAVSAVEDWEFEPIFENGSAVEKLAAVRMMFAIE
jgi:TonB family protein